MFDLYEQSFIYYGKNNHSSSPIHAAEVVHTTINLQEVRKFMQCAFVHSKDIHYSRHTSTGGRRSENVDKV